MKRRRTPARLRTEELDRRDVPAVFGVPWPTADLTLSFAPDGTTVNGSPSTLAATVGNAGHAEILRAFQTWITAANVNVGVVADGGQAVGAPGGPVHDPRFGDVRLAAAPLDGVVALALPFDLTAGTRAGDVWLNNTLPFGTGAGTFYDVYTTVLHEAGHVFGLPGNETDPDSVMRDEPLVPRTGLAAADVAGIVALYGARNADSFEGIAGNATPATATEIKPSGGSASGSSDTITITADLTTAADTDTYWFKPNNLRGQGLTVSVGVSGYSLLVPRLEVLDSHGTVIATGGGDTPGVGSVSLHLPGAVEGDKYFLRVTSGSATFGVGGYHLSVVNDAASGGGGGDAVDPESGQNDSSATATTLEQLYKDTGPRIDYTLSAGLGTSTDSDVYRLRAPHENGNSAGVFTVLLWSNGPPGFDPVVEVTDHHGAPVPGVVLAHDGGAFTLQVPDAAANDDYYVRVRHAHPATGAVPGNYSLAVDFGGVVSDLPLLGTGTLTAAAPFEARDVSVDASQAFHLTLTVAGSSAVAGVRLSVLDTAGHVVDSRLAFAGETVSMTPYLPAGPYRLLAAGGTTDGSAALHLSYSIRGGSVSDPIGPRAVDVTGLPVGTPPPTVPPAVPPNVPPTVPPGVPPAPPPSVPPTVSVSPAKPLTPITPVDPTSPNWIVTPPTDWPAPSGTSLKPAAKPLPRTVSVGAGAGGAVKSFAADGTQQFSVTPFPGFTGGVRTAEADFNADGVADLVVGTGPGGATHVRVLDGVTRSELFAVDPFEAAFTGGVYVAAGDVTGDGVPDVIVTPDEGGGPRVDVYNGGTFGKFASFFGIDDRNFRGGARAAVGDLTGDGVSDLIVAAGFGGGPRVAGFDGTTLAGTPARIFADFFAFEQGLRNGVFVAAGDTDGDGKADLVVGGGPGGGPRVTIFGGSQLLQNEYFPTANFFTGNVAGRGGVRVAVKDFDADGRADVVVGAGVDSGNRVTAYRGADLQAGSQPPELTAFDAFSGSAAGVYVG